MQAAPKVSTTKLLQAGCRGLLPSQLLGKPQMTHGGGAETQGWGGAVTLSLLDSCPAGLGDALGWAGGEGAVCLLPHGCRGDACALPPKHCTVPLETSKPCALCSLAGGSREARTSSSA